MPKTVNVSEKRKPGASIGGKRRASLKGGNVQEAAGRVTPRLRLEHYGED